MGKVKAYGIALALGLLAVYIAGHVDAVGKFLWPPSA